MIRISGRHGSNAMIMTDGEASTCATGEIVVEIVDGVIVSVTLTRQPNRSSGPELELHQDRVQAPPLGEFPDK